MGVSASVSCTPYEGRTIRLLAEQLRYENGQSYVAWRIFSEGGAGQFYGIGPITAAINGTLVYSKGLSPYSGGSTAAFPVAAGSVSGGLWITHSGSRTISLTLEAYVYMDTGDGPYSATLTLSASGSSSGGGSTGDYAATPILFVAGADLGQSCTVCFAPDWEGYSYRLSCYSAAGALVQMKQLTPRSSGQLQEVSLLLPYNLAQGGELSVTAKIHLATYRGTSSNAFAYKVGADSVWNLEVHVAEDENTRPQLTAVFSPSPDPLEGTYIQNKTGVAARISASGKYGADIQRTWFRVEGRDYEAGEVSALLSRFGSLTVTAYAVDSRGFTAQPVTVTLEALAYSGPKLRPAPGQSRVTAIRCDGEGDPQEDGAYVILKASREYSPLTAEGVQRNFCVLRCRYKPDISDTWSGWTVILPEDSQQDSVVTPPLIGTLAPRSAYQIELQALDTLGSAASTLLPVYSDRIYWHRHGALGSLGFGKYAEEADVFDIAAHKTLRVRGGLDLQGDAYAFLLDLSHPTGSLLETTRPDDPASYLGGQWLKMEQTESTTKWRRLQ